MIRFFRKNKFIITVSMAGAILIAIIIGFHSLDNSQNVKIIEYIESLGWQIEQRPVEISYLTIPRVFDPAFENYNTYQKEAGFDLTSFKGTRAARYSYRVLNHQFSEFGTVRANVIMVSGQIVAADISSNVPNGGFMHAITEMAYLDNR